MRQLFAWRARFNWAQRTDGFHHDTAWQYAYPSGADSADLYWVYTDYHCALFRDCLAYSHYAVEAAGAMSPFPPLSIFSCRTHGFTGRTASCTTSLYFHGPMRVTTDRCSQPLGRALALTPSRRSARPGCSLCSRYSCRCILAWRWRF